MKGTDIALLVIFIRSALVYPPLRGHARPFSAKTSAVVSLRPFEVIQKPPVLPVVRHGATFSRTFTQLSAASQSMIQSSLSEASPYSRILRVIGYFLRAASVM